MHVVSLYNRLIGATLQNPKMDQNFGSAQGSGPWRPRLADQMKPVEALASRGLQPSWSRQNMGSK